MYLAGVSTRQVDDVAQLLWGDRMPSQTLSDKLRKVYADIDAWRERPLEQEYAYVFMDGVWHKRCWGGSVENVSVLVAIGVGADGRREVLSVAEGMKEDAESWRSFIKGMLARGLRGVRLVTGDRCAGLVAAVGELLPGARHQRCMVHFERNILGEGGIRRRGDGFEEARGRPPNAFVRASARPRPTCSTATPASIAAASARTT